MNAATMLLVRHAEIECTGEGGPLLCGSHDAALSAKGREQVKQLRVRLASEVAVAAYSSPLRRTVETAQAAPEPLLMNLRLLRTLAEMHCGDVEGMAIERIKEQFPDVWRASEAQDDECFRWPGGETFRRFRRRVIRLVCALARRHAGERILIFTHAGVVNQILGFMARQSAARWENFRPHNTSITEVLWNETSGRLIRFDD